jgi:O-antigen ligase
VVTGQPPRALPESALLETGTVLLLLGVPLIFSTHLQSAVLAPKEALLLVGTAVVLAAWLLGAWRGLWPFSRRQPLVLAGFALYGWWTVRGLAGAPAPGAWQGTLTAALSGLLLAAWSASMDGRRARRWLAYPALAALVAAGYSALQRAGLDWVPWNYPHLSRDRTIATFGNPDYLAWYLAPGLFLILSLSLGLRRPWARAAGLAAGAGTAAIMVLTLTRAAWVAALVGAGVWLAARASRRLLLGAAAGGLVLVLGLGGLALASPQAGPYTLAGRLRSLADFADLSLRTRFFLWQAALRIAAEHPLGAGVDSYPFLALQHRDLEPPETRTLLRVPENPHNEYLSVLVETGLPGLALLGLTLGLFFTRAWQRRREGLEAVGVLAGGAALWTGGLFLSATPPHALLGLFLLAWTAGGGSPPAEPAPPDRPEEAGGGTLSEGHAPPDRPEEAGSGTLSEAHAPPDRPEEAGGGTLSEAHAPPDRPEEAGSGALSHRGRRPGPLACTLAALGVAVAGLIAWRQVATEHLLWRAEGHLYSARADLARTPPDWETARAHYEAALHCYLGEAPGARMGARQLGLPGQQAKIHRGLGDLYLEIYSRLAGQDPKTGRPTAALQLAELAEKACAEACALEPENPYHHRSLARVREILARAAGQARTPEAARREWHTALKQDPWNPVFWAEYGDFLLRWGETARSLEAFRRSLALAPDLAWAWLRYGEALCRSGRAQEAHQAARRAVEQDPGLSAPAARILEGNCR